MVNLASETEADVKRIVDDLRVNATRADMTGDPMRDVLSVMADAVAVIGRAGEPKIDERVIRSAVMSAVLRVSKDAISTMRWWLLLVSTLSIIVLCIGSVAVDRYLVRTPDPRWLSLAAMNDIGKAWSACRPMAEHIDEACWFPFWIKQPLAK